MPKAAPLSPEYFAPPVLSDRETQWLIKHARESARVLVESVRGGSHGAVRWHEAGSYKRVQMYKGEPVRPARRARGSDDSRVHMLCGRTIVDATLEQVAAFFDVSSTPKMKAFVATQDDIQDGVVLYTLVAPGPENEYLHQITVKWMAVRMPSGIVKARDFLTLECQDSFTDPSGKRGWVRSYHSIKMPCVPDLQQTLGFVRGSMYHSGYVFVESDTPGVLTCLSSLQVDLKGNLVLPKALYDAGVKRRISALAHLQHKLHARLREQPQLFRGDLDCLAVNNERAWCQLCAMGFSVFTRKHLCRACGAVVCHACTESLSIVLSANEHVAPTKVRVCVLCASKRAKRGTTESTDAGIKRQRATQLSIREGPFHTDPGAYLQRPIGNHRGRSDTRLSRRQEPRQLQQQRSLIEYEKPLCGEESFVSTGQASRLFHDRASPTPLLERDVSIKFRRDDSLTLAPRDEPSGLGSSSRGEHGSISFCDSLDGFHATMKSLVPCPPQEDPAVSAVELYRGILALQRAQRTALSVSTRQRLAEELSVLYTKLDAAMELYELEH